MSGWPRLRKRLLLAAMAALWVTLLVFVWPLAAPLYWLLYVRPTGPPGGGP